MTAVNGTRIVPPSMAPILIRGQNPTPSFGKNIDSTPPSAPPIMSNGARTPPEVPDPSARAQIAAFTASIPMRILPGTSPRSNPQSFRTQHQAPVGTPGRPNQ